ncbi:MAG TPA: class I SAM-dependent methyltransferase [Thermoanaerobaculia bacterium]|nr:class I SAM-dependent methyltransferase [Thermoanaerobaculia bacterium]
MANSLCRAAINRRVSGNPSEWPLDWLRRVHVRTSFRRAVSWGCGLGAFERSARKLDLVERIDAFDISQASIRDARQRAEDDGLTGIVYGTGDFNDPQIAREGYDVAFFHASLHHVAALERMFRRLAIHLDHPSAIYVDEYVGPSRFHWTAEKLTTAQAMLDRVPDNGKTATLIPPPIEQTDPSEAYRSDEIPSFLRTFCDIVAWRPYGGQIVDLVFPFLRPDWVHSQEGSTFVAAMLDAEDRELSENPELTHYLVAYGSLKAPWRLVTPLGRQAIAAVRRRLQRS